MLHSPSKAEIEAGNYKRLRFFTEKMESEHDKSGQTNLTRGR